MNINLTKRQIIIIGAVIVLLILIVLVLLMVDKSSDEDVINQPQVYDADNVNQQASTKPHETVNTEEATAKSFARNFVARYLSYSNENWGDNIDVLLPQMTEAMQQYAQKNLLSLKNEHPADDFYGVSAKVLSQTATEEAGDYTINSSVQLQERIGNDEKISYAEYKVELLTSGDNWLVNSVRLLE